MLCTIDRTSELVIVECLGCTQVFSDWVRASRFCHPIPSWICIYDRVSKSRAWGRTTNIYFSFWMGLFTLCCICCKDAYSIVLLQFDYLKSLEIEEKINKIRWCTTPNAALFMLSANNKTIKLWKVRCLRDMIRRKIKYFVYFLVE